MGRLPSVFGTLAEVWKDIGKAGMPTGMLGRTACVVIDGCDHPIIIMIVGHIRICRYILG